MEIGNPGQGQKKKKNYFYIKQGKQSFRILPPLGNLAKTGVWSKYYEVHFGYKNNDGFMRPFQSCEVKSKDRKMIEIDDPATERLKRLESQLKEVQERLKTNPSAQLREVAVRLEKLVGFEDGQFDLQKGHYVNAINDKGEIGLLKLKHKEKLALEEARKAIQAKYSLDPIGVEGAYIEFSKSGRSFDTLISAVGAMEIQADQSERLKRHNLLQDEVVKNRLSEDAFELDNLYVAPSREDILAMVTAYEKNDLEGQQAVTEVFRRLQPRSNDSESKSEVKSEVKAESKKESKKEETQPDLSMTETRTETKVEAKPEVKVEASAAQSEEDFLKSIGALPS